MTNPKTKAWEEMKGLEKCCPEHYFYSGWDAAKKDNLKQSIDRFNSTIDRLRGKE